MLGIHWPEFMLIAVVTVLVVGPKELPRVLRTITRMLRRIQGLSREFQTTMNDLAKEADLDDVKNDFTEIESRVADMRVEDELDKTLDGDNKIAGMFTGDVIGTELAEDANKKDKPAEIKDDFEEQMDSEVVEKIESKPEPGAAKPNEGGGGDSKEPETVAANDGVAANAGDDGDTKAGPPDPVAESESAASAARA